jgi:threonine aldolase
MTDTDAARLDALRRACTRFLHAHGQRGPAEIVAELPDDIEEDRYGDGGVVSELEARVADLLGKPAAVFMPSGTMAQQIALRIHADRRGRRTVAFHPTCHIDLYENRAYERLHGLNGRPIGDPKGLLTLDDIDGVAEPLAALVLELPQREIGGPLPEWDDLVAQRAWARRHGTALHLDGARVWECGPHYGRPLSDIAGLFDSVYVSFYKGLGAVSGSCLAGERDLIAEAREWRHRHGGTMFALWPYAASALAALRLRLDRMQAYMDHALAIAGALRDLPDVTVVPDPPQTPMMHIHLRADLEALDAAMEQIAQERRIWTWRRCHPSDHPGWQRVELAVGDATLGFTPGEVRDLIAHMVAS